MAKRTAREYLSKSDVIRQYLRDHPDAKPRDDAAALKAQVIGKTLAERRRLAEKPAA